MLVNKIKLFWRLKKSQWFQSSKYFCDWVRMNTSLKSGWPIQCTWMANGMLWGGQLTHPSNLVGQSCAHGWPMGYSGLANELRGGNSGCPPGSLCHRLYLLGGGPPSWYTDQARGAYQDSWTSQLGRSPTLNPFHTSCRVPMHFSAFPRGRVELP